MGRPRQLRPELIDQDRLADSELVDNLLDLRRVHRWLGGSRALRRLRSWLENQPAQGRLRLLDVACGGGDGLQEIVQLAAQRGWTANAIGLDRNLRVLKFAARSRAATAASWVQGDASRLPFRDASFDLVYCSLLLHHRPDPEVPALLGELWRVSRRALLVVELQRSRWAWALVTLGAAVSLRGRATRHDGPLSVLQSFRARELDQLARRAGLPQAQIATTGWFRLALWAERERSPAQQR